MNRGLHKKKILLLLKFNIQLACLCILIMIRKSIDLNTCNFYAKGLKYVGWAIAHFKIMVVQCSVSPLEL